MMKHLLPKNVIVYTLFVFALFAASMPQAQQISAPQVDGFTLVNADTGEAIINYQNNSEINSHSISADIATRISIRFNARNSGSVKISGATDQPRIENQAPYSLLGDDAGVYTPWSPSVGVHTIVVEPFSEGRAAGVSGEAATLELTITQAIEETIPTPVNSAVSVLPSIISLLLDDQERSTPTVNIEDVCASWDGIFPDNAFTVTQNDRLNLQQLLDRHNVLRLTPGDYRNGGVNQLSIDSNQSIIALTPTLFPDVEVAAGATGVRLEGLQNTRVSFETGQAIRYNCFKGLREADIIVDGATVERNMFVGFFNTAVTVDTSQRGYFSDNRFIKLNSQARQIPINLRGDSNRRSGGNAFLLVDAQTPLGSAFSIDGQRDISFVGVDLESYDARFEGGDEPFAFKVRNTGTFRAIQSSGMNRRNPRDQNGDEIVNLAPSFDIDAERIFMHQFTAPTPDPVLRIGADNDLLFSWRNELSSTLIDDNSDNDQALRTFAQEYAGRPFIAENGRESLRVGYQEDVAFFVDDERQDSLLNSQIANRLHAETTQTEVGSAAWSIPEFAQIPDPTGPNWSANLGQREDESAAIQALVDANGIAQLEPRTYYVGSSIRLDRDQGIIGAGADKTAIVALNDNVNIIDLAWTNLEQCEGTGGRVTVAEITLQGGQNGIISRTPGTQINRSVISHVTFRNMANAGILVDGVFGWDNNFLDHANFVDSAYGFRQILGEDIEQVENNCYRNGEWETMTYVDKTVFYRNQFLRLGTAITLNANRANNLNGIAESSFEANTTNAISLRGGNLGFMVASSRFVNNAGNPVIAGNVDTTIVNSIFEAGPGQSMISSGAHVEGSIFTAGGTSNAVVFAQPLLQDFRNPRFFDVSNSVLEIPLGPVATADNVTGMYFNNDRVAGDSLTGFFSLVEFITNGTVDRSQHSREVIPLITNRQSSPGSMLLRGANWSN